MDAGALDDLDLDGMFADDGDMLFEGLDIGLDDAMGDIISNEKSNISQTTAPSVIEPPVTSSVPKTKRPGGPRTKRTNPMLEKANKVKEETAPAAPSSKRRKTKRKTKAPTAFGDDDDESTEQQPPPKKKRKASTKTKKTAEPVIVTAKTKRKKKSETLAASSSIGLGASGTTKISSTKSSVQPPPSSVAASGQFGGRQKKVGTTKIKRKLKKSSTDGNSENVTTAPPILLKPPKPEPTFGGLHPSNNLFYPFLESVPAESTMQKRKTYPIMDRISSTLTSQLLSYAPKVQDMHSLGVAEDSAIFKLMLDTYEGNEKDKKNFTSEKRASLLRAISLLRKMVYKVDKNNLVKDVFAMCGLLTREYNFLKQTLDNMKVWCKNEFDDDKYKETYEPPIEQPKIKKWKCTTGVVKVKIVCTGFKEPKGIVPLFAMLPTIVFDSTNSRPISSSTASAISKAFATNELKKGAAIPIATSSGAKAAATTLTKKKRKEKLVEKPKLKAGSSSQAPSSPVPKTYPDLTPLARRQQIIERVSQLALELESSMQKEKMFGRLDPIPEEQPPLHTTRMWDWLQSAGFYNKAASSRVLASIKSPITHSRGPFQLIPKAILGRNVNEEEDTQRVSSASLFDRLQSLLVEEESDDEMDHSEGEESDEDSLDFLDNDDSDNVDDIEKALESGEINKYQKFDIADLSELSIEERTFVHLSKAGLIKKPLYRTVNLVNSTGEYEGEESEDLGDVIGNMSTDLKRITSMNNARISFIERLASDADVSYNKQIEEENTVLIAKCQNLMKRTKEKAKKAKQKKDENLNLPW